MKATFSFNYARLIVIAVSLCSLIFFLSFYLITSLLSRWFNPEHLQMETSRRIIVLAAKVDSLALEVEKKDAYITHFKEIMNNEVDKKGEKSKKNENFPEHASVQFGELSPEDSLLRKKFENEEIFNQFSKSSRSRNTGLVLNEPLKGVVLQRYDLKNGQKGVTISCSESDKIAAMHEGLVLQISRENKENLICIFSEGDNLLIRYQFNGQVVVKEGELIKRGECIGITDTGTPQLYLEMRHEGRLTDPENFIQL